MSKRNESQAIVTSTLLDIIAIRDIFILDSELFPQDYYTFQRDHSRHGGIVLIAVRNSFSSLHHYDLESYGRDYLVTNDSIRYVVVCYLHNI